MSGTLGLNHSLAEPVGYPESCRLPRDGHAGQETAPKKRENKFKKKKIFQTVANKVSLALRLGMAPKSSLSPWDRALEPGMRVTCVGAVHVSVSGLENMCAVVPRKSFLLWALLQKTSFLAFTTVPGSLGLPRCLTQPEDRELRSFLCHSLCPPGLGAASLFCEVGGMGWSPRPWSDQCAALTHSSWISLLGGDGASAERGDSQTPWRAKTEREEESCWFLLLAV